MDKMRDKNRDKNKMILPITIPVTILGSVNTCFALALLTKKREGKARSAGHSEPMAKLCSAASAFFRAQPRGTGRNFT